MLRSTAVAGAGIWITSTASGAETTSPNEKLNIAVIGIGGQGGGNLNRPRIEVMTGSSETI